MAGETTTLSREAASGGGRIFSGLRKDKGAEEPSAAENRLTVNEILDRRYTLKSSEHTGSEKTLDRKGRVKQIDGENRAWTEEIFGEIVKDITTELNNLAELQTGNPEERADFHDFMNHPAFRLQKDFFDHFTDPKSGSDERSVNIDKLKEWLSTDRGLQDAYELAIMRSQGMLVNSGVLSSMEKKISRIPQPEGVANTDVTTREGFRPRELARGLKIWAQEDKVDTTGRKTPFMGIKKKGTIGAAVVGLTIATGGVGVAAYGALGLATGGLPPVGAGIIRSFRGGGRVRIEASKEALQIAKTDDPVMQSWSRRMYDMDVRNISIRNGKVVIDQDILRQGVVSPSMDLKTATGKLVEEDRKIRAMQEKMGVQERLRGGMDKQFIKEGYGHDPQRGIVSEEDVLTALKQDPRMVDHNGNRCMVNIAPAGARPDWRDNTPAFFARYGRALGLRGAFDRNTMTPDENIAAWKLKREIRVRLAHERHELNWGKLLESKNDRLPNLRTKVDTALAAEGSGGNSTKRIDDRLAELKIDEDSLPGIARPFEGFEASLTERDKKLRAESNIQARIIDTASGNPVVNVEQAINDILSPPGSGYTFTPMRIGSITIRSFEDFDQEIDNYVLAEMGKWNSDPNNKRVDRPTEHTRLVNEAKYDADLAKYNAWPADRAAYEKNLRENSSAARRIQARSDAQEALLLKTLTDLQESRHAAHEEEVKLASTGPENRVRTETNKAVREMRDALATIEGMSAAAVNLSAAALESENQEELLRRINQANQLNSRMGWPESANKEPVNRELLLRAMTEASIEEVTPEYDEAIDPNHWGLTEYDLFMMSRDQIKAIVDQRAPRLPGAPSAPELDDIDDLKSLAQDRFGQRRVRLEELRHENEIRQRELTNERVSVMAEGGKSPELATIKKAVDRYADIRTSVGEMTRQQLVDALDSRRAIDVDPDEIRFLPSERNNNNSVAICEILQMVFDHRSHDQDSITFRGETGRDAAFNRNANLVNATELRDALVAWFHMPVFAPVVRWGTSLGTFEEHIDVIRNEIDAGNIPPEDFAEFLTESVIFGFMAPRVDRL